MIRKVYTETDSFHVFKIGKAWYTVSGVRVKMDHTVVYSVGPSFPFTVSYGFVFREWLRRITRN